MRNNQIKILSSDDFYVQGLSHLCRGAYGAALTALTSAIALDSRSLQALYTRAVLCGQLDDDRASIADLSAVIRLAPERLRAYALRGMAYKLVGDLRAALDDFSRLVEMEPTDSDAYFQRAEIYAELGFAGDAASFERAVADYTCLLRLNPDEYRIYRNRGLVRAAAGDIDGAIADCRCFLDRAGHKPADRREVESLIDSLERGRQAG